MEKVNIRQEIRISTKINLSFNVDVLGGNSFSVLFVSLLLALLATLVMGNGDPDLDVQL